LLPVVCVDEMNKQLLEDRRIPCAPGDTEKVDSVYKRAGIADVFMAFEPLAGKRVTQVTQTRTAIDFAEFVKTLLDVHYPQAERVRLVMDNLSTHTTASLYKAFEPAEARRLAKRLEIHHTPAHGSWLNMAEIEIGILSRQALAKPLPNIDAFRQQVSDWNLRRNMGAGHVNWRFSTPDARIKLKRLYPVVCNS
jgi:hypothetical protein